MWKRRLQTVFWWLLGCACVVLLVAAMQAKDRKACSDVKIDLGDDAENVFVDTAEIALVLQHDNAVKGVELENIPLSLVEKDLEKNAWIKDAQLFFDNNQLLTVKIEERKPLARIFTIKGKSFYIDSAAMLLPLSDRHTARAPVFTSFPMERDTLSHNDSAVLQDIKQIAAFIQADSFWMAQVAQVDVTPQHTYQVIPVLGNQVINLGTADELDMKFRKLFAFYRQVWAKTGFEKYEKIDLQYEGQVVAVRKGVALLADSAQQAGSLVDSSLVVTRTVAPAPVLRDTIARRRAIMPGGGPKPAHHKPPKHPAAGSRPARGNARRTVRPAAGRN
jgi:cell division protein FtsQ